MIYLGVGKVMTTYATGADAESNEERRPVNLSEAKQLITLRLRDPRTDAKSFTRLIGIYSKLHGWKRKPRRVEKDSNVDDIVLALERQQRLKRAKAKD